jgi:hypothetical protein
MFSNAVTKFKGIVLFNTNGDKRKFKENKITRKNNILSLLNFKKSTK